MSVKKRSGDLSEGCLFSWSFTCKSVLTGQNKQCQQNCPLSSSMLNPTALRPEKLVNLKIDNEQNSLKFWSLEEEKG